MTRDLRTVADDARMTYVHVVRKACALHDKIPVADPRFAAGMRGAYYYRIFSDYIFIADTGDRVFALIKEILRFRPDHRTVEDAISVSHAGAAHNTCMRHDDIIIAYFYVFVNIDKRTNRYIFPDLCRRIDICQWTNHNHSFKCYSLPPPKALYKSITA